MDREASRLSAVCRTFRDETPWILEQWTLQREKLRVLHQFTFTSYIDDLINVAGLKKCTVASACAPLRPGRTWRSRNEYAKLRRLGEDAHSIPYTAGIGNGDGNGLAELEGPHHQPFAALEKWRLRKLEDTRREEQARSRGDWKMQKELQRKALMVKKERKFENFNSLSRPDQQNGSGSGDGQEIERHVEGPHETAKQPKRRRTEEARQERGKQEVIEVRRLQEQKAELVTRCLRRSGDKDDGKEGV